MTGATAQVLESHLIRGDGQEDVVLATYRPSTGRERRTALITEVLMPDHGDRAVHGNATVYDQYVLRAVDTAARRGDGVMMAHSHPGASTWQSMSGPDRDAESSFGNLVRELTGQPLVGMTLAGRSATWSARHWDVGAGPEIGVTHCESVRVIGDSLRIAWNDQLRPVPRATSRQARTISCWGHRMQEDIMRLRVLVVGVGSVGLDVAVRLAAMGFEVVGVADFDLVEARNLDRMIGATSRDVRLRRSKIHVAARMMSDAATAADFRTIPSDLSVCEPDGVDLALDFDVIFCCVDRPWARAVLNSLAFTDLIPVIDGGIVIDTFDDGTLRNGTWRSHVVRPGRPCMSCSRQLDLGQVALDIDGLLEDPAYVRGSDQEVVGQNVAALSCNVSSSLLAQLVSFLVAPGGQGDPGPLQYVLSTHTMEHLPFTSREKCPVEASTSAGDARVDLTGAHPAAEAARATSRDASLWVRLLRSVDDSLTNAQRLLGHGSTPDP